MAGGGLDLSPLAQKEIDTCVHCGFCLPACPTYRELGNEADSPRGRIHLVRNLLAGDLAPTDPVLAHLDLCLACRACETACPSGVRYGHIIEEARARLEPQRRRPAAARLLRRLFFRGLFPHPHRLRLLARAVRLTQRLGLDRLAARTGLIRLLPRPVAAMAPVAAVSPVFARERLPQVVPAQGPRRWRVGFVTGCVMDVLCGPTNLASVHVLAKNGCEVVIPPTQTCCGALMVHSGDAATARDLARRNIDAFLDAGVDYIIINAAGCGSTLKEYHHLLHDDPAYRDRAAAFAAKVRDITEFLAGIDLVPPSHPVPARVTYQDPCHLAHGQGVRAEPRRLLRQIPGLELVEMADPDACCGSAGIYNLTQFDMSMAVLDRKMDRIQATGARVVASANPGCILQLRLGAHRRGLDLEVVHVVDLLARAYGLEGAGTPLGAGDTAGAAGGGVAQGTGGGGRG